MLFIEASRRSNRDKLGGGRLMEIKVVDRWDTLEKWVYIFQRDPNGVRLLRIVQEEQMPQEHRWIYVPDSQMAELGPTIVLKNEWLDQLVEQLIGTGLGNNESLEEIYLHERERVDKLIDYATQAQVQIWDSSTQGRP